MRQQVRTWKVAADLFWAQGMWSLWFLAIISSIHIVMLVFAIRSGGQLEDYMTFTFGGAKVFMLVIGIIGALHFTKFYVSNGVTRKECYTGTIYGVAGLSLVLAVLSGIITGVEYGILKLFDIQSVIDHAAVGNLIGDDSKRALVLLPAELLGRTILRESTNVLVSIILFAAASFVYYLIGWFIGAGYSRFNWLIGTLLNIPTIILMIVLGNLWGDQIEKPFSYVLPFDLSQSHISVMIVGTIAFIALILWLIRLMTRRIVVKM